MSWSFREMHRREMNTDPSEGEFFTPELLSDALVRESIQNSLDAKRNGECVRVRIHFSCKSALSARMAQPYLNDLWPHLKAVENGRSSLLGKDASVQFLVIEDFGTRGLCGPVDQYTDDGPSDSAHNDFFYFWRNIGRSRKEETQRGRWGIGKTVFPAASLVNSFFGFTIRYDDHKSYLMGQSILKIHEIAGTRYCPYGFYAKLGDEDFPYPFGGGAKLAQFRSDFQLVREDEPGLSIVIPFPDVEEIGAKQMLQSAITHYFFPILKKELIVEVSDDSFTEAVDANNIDEVVDSVDWSNSIYSPDRLRHLFALVRRAVELHESQLLLLPEPKPPRAPDWNVGRFDSNTVTLLKKQFAENQMLAVRVPVTVRKKKDKDRPTYFDVFVEQDQTMSRAEDHYIRQGITISKISTLREKGFRGLVIVDDDALSTLLGDAENPAHTEWLEKATKLRERFEWGPYTVRFVRNALKKIVAQLLHIPEGRDEELLRSIFFLEDELETAQPAGERKHKLKKSDATEEGAEEEEVPPVTILPPAVTVHKIDGGFRVAGNSDAEAMPDEVSVAVAYEVRRGNAFKKYVKWDFNLASKPIVIASVAADCCADGNTMVIQPSRKEFLVEVTGFDSHRDLAIRVGLKKKEVVDAETI